MLTAPCAIKAAPKHTPGAVQRLTLPCRNYHGIGLQALAVDLGYLNLR